MSAPAGWHPQPDGRDRYWDGSQWTQQFRAAGQVGATAPLASGHTPTGASKAGVYKPWMGYTGAAFVAFILGIGVGGSGDAEAGTAALASAPAVTVTSKSVATTTATATVTAGPTPTATVTATTKVTAPPPAPVASITDGTWTVGVDIKAGTYKVIEAVSDQCYWGITKTGSNGDNIIANDIVDGGRPQVTLKKGQDFESSCGDWKRV